MLVQRLGVPARLVRDTSELHAAHGLILPGGESTSIAKLMARVGLDEAIRQRASEGLPIFGTCAGLILMAKEIEGSSQPRLGLLDLAVARNAFGPQVESFEADIDAPELGAEPIRGVFIRAPQITRFGEQVKAMATLNRVVVLVRQGNLLAGAFHPELTGDVRIHEYFVKMVRDAKESAVAAIPAAADATAAEEEKESSEEEEDKKARNKISAALVTKRPVCPRPSTMALPVSCMAS